MTTPARCAMILPRFKDSRWHKAVNPAEGGKCRFALPCPDALRVRAFSVDAIKTTEVKTKMPNAKVLSEKQAVVAELKEKLKGAAAGVLVDYSGITVADDTALRRKMREEKVDYAVVKNTLVRFAIDDAGYSDLDPLLHGTTSLAISHEDALAPARVVAEFAEKLQNCFEIKGGFMDGKVISVDEIKALAKIPPLPILRAQVLGTMLAPISQLACVLKAIAEKQGAPAGEPEPAPAE